MTQEKQLRFLVTVPRGSEERYRLWARALRELHQTPNKRSWRLISEDIDRLLLILKEVKQDVKNN
jgi:hypothetical protein